MTAPPPIPSADAHPPAPDDDAIFEYDGITYRVSELMAFDPRDTQPSGIPTARVARTARAATAWRRAQRTAEAATVKILLSADVIYELLAEVPTPLGAGGLTLVARDRLTEAGVVLRALQLRTPNLGWALDRLVRSGRVVALPGSQAVERWPPEAFDPGWSVRSREWVYVADVNTGRFDRQAAEWRQAQSAIQARLDAVAARLSRRLRPGHPLDLRHTPQPDEPTTITVTLDLEDLERILTTTS
jgi:hypothetical protein